LVKQTDSTPQNSCHWLSKRCCCWADAQTNKAMIVQSQNTITNQPMNGLLAVSTRESISHKAVMRIRFYVQDSEK